MANIVLQVELDDGDLLSGSVGFANGNTFLAFEGWIGFMAAIDRLRKEPGEEAQ